MLCKFCQHEFDDSLTECPYCHKQVDFEPKSLTREERDNFVGTKVIQNVLNIRKKTVIINRMTRTSGRINPMKTTAIHPDLRCIAWAADC